MTNISDRPSPVECAMCRKRLSSLETVQIDLGARLNEQSGMVSKVKEDVVELREELRESLSELRNEMRVSNDILRVRIEEIQKSGALTAKDIGDIRKDMASLRAAGSADNDRIVKLLERVLESVAKPKE